MKSKAAGKMPAAAPEQVFEALRQAGFEVILFGGAAGKWSFVGIVDRKVKVPEGEKGLSFMREYIKKHRAGGQFNARGQHNPPFNKGFMGFLSYDLGAEWLGVKRSGVSGRLASGCPASHFVFVDKVVAFENLGRGRCRIYIPKTLIPDVIARSPDVRRDDEAIYSTFARLLRCARNDKNLRNDKAGKSFLTSSRPSRGEAYCITAPPLSGGASSPKSNLTYPQYAAKIQTVKNYLFSGDTYQVNFSQKFNTPFRGSAFSLYKRLAEINPSPFQFFLENERFAVVSNSPERLFSITRDAGGKFIIQTRPIKGTAPTGRTRQEEKNNIKKMLASEKERAELAMIVDLERNDLGKICEIGTVEVDENRTLEKYSHVIHTVANIRGVLKKKHDWYDSLVALFPGGSVTGCPKKRTVEIISELEADPRGVYCGSAGWIDLGGQCDFNIMIRTLWLEKNKKSSGGRPAPLSGRIVFRSGGGIVVDSEAKREYQETMHKSQALFAAINSIR